jgi:hypothetical protein
MSKILIRLPAEVHQALKDEAHQRRQSLQMFCLTALQDMIVHRLRPHVAEAALQCPVTDALAGESQDLASDAA